MNVISRFLSKTVKPDGEDGCWIWTGTKLPKGYGTFYFDRTRMYAHRFSYQHFVGAIPEGMFVCHHCDNPSCVNPAHLWVGTNTDNMRDSARKGRNVAQKRPEIRRGERCGHAKLSLVQVQEIRRLYSAGGFSQQELAIRFGVGKSQIGNIVQGKSWAHVQEILSITAELAAEGMTA